MITSLYVPEEDATYEAAKNLTMIREEQLDFAFNNLTKQQLINRIMCGKSAILVESHEIDIDKVTLELAHDDEFCFEVLFNSEFKDLNEYQSCVNKKIEEIISTKLDEIASDYEYELKVV